MRWKKEQVILTAAARGLLMLARDRDPLDSGSRRASSATPDRGLRQRITPAARATLGMSAHPHCPCTRASLGELARLMTQAQGRVTAYVLFVKPPNFSGGWEQTDLWASAAAIPGVTAVRDDGGDESRLFHAATSGQTALYDAAGSLLFSGALRAARGTRAITRGARPSFRCSTPVTRGGGTRPCSAARSLLGQNARREEGRP